MTASVLDRVRVDTFSDGLGSANGATIRATNISANPIEGVVYAVVSGGERVPMEWHVAGGCWVCAIPPGRWARDIIAEAR